MGDVSNVITKEGIAFKVNLDNQQLLLMGIGGFIVFFFAFLLAALLANKISGK